MDEEDNADIAAAMGFASFGGTKKRKFDHANSPKARADASGANSTKLGVRTKTASAETGIVDVAGADFVGQTKQAQADSSVGSEDTTLPTGSGLASFLARGQNLPEKPVGLSELGGQSTADTVSFGGPSISKAELNALRNGVQNENGDTAYFLPSFVEDPWAKLPKSGSK
ncbi:hypothetical protein DDE82_005280 [Stemphylium lycopersici]|uniref:Uncharacterized protein n=1 Tax=Stemphylium lycopersici TaxID=183478 RepID=A0A364N8A6_STELY|nr:hypothetical protein DDE82_005280 [Stemphylium lycopersici]RAR13510.1 hypothetical protein DDE83_003109 [Stemphylium lycopersici]